MLYNIIYVILGFLVAVCAGVFIYRDTKSRTSFDYVPALAAGLLWPLAVGLWLVSKILEAFMNFCIQIAHDVDELEQEKKEKSRKKKPEPGPQSPA